MKLILFPLMHVPSGIHCCIIKIGRCWLIIALCVGLLCVDGGKVIPIKSFFVTWNPGVMVVMPFSSIVGFFLSLFRVSLNAQVPICTSFPSIRLHIDRLPWSVFSHNSLLPLSHWRPLTYHGIITFFKIPSHVKLRSGKRYVLLYVVAATKVSYWLYWS